MKKIHHEFSYQSQELGAQIDDTLGEPPDRKAYARIIKSLIAEFANGYGLDDVNMLSFALADYLAFKNPAGLMAQSEHYDKGDAAKVYGMVSCADAEAGRALSTMFACNPELTRKAIITVFLYKNPKRWTQEDNSLEALQMEEDAAAGVDDEDEYAPGHEMDELFDSHEE